MASQKDINKREKRRRQREAALTSQIRDQILGIESATGLDLIPDDTRGTTEGRLARYVQGLGRLGEQIRQRQAYSALSSIVAGPVADSTPIPRTYWLGLAVGGFLLFLIIRRVGR